VAAWAECSDFLLAGPVYETRSHPDLQAQGVEIVVSVRKRVALPIVGIGGITAERAGEVIQAGASGIAVISAILNANSPREAARELRGAVDEKWVGSRD
jgi:thiamine-phosphate diphosphorylase